MTRILKNYFQISELKFFYSKTGESVQITWWSRQSGSFYTARQTFCKPTQIARKELVAARDSQGHFTQPDKLSVNPDRLARKTRTVRTEIMVNSLQLARMMDISEGSVHSMLTEDLKMRHICNIWVSHHLTHEQFQKQIDVRDI